MNRSEMKEKLISKGFIDSYNDEIYHLNIGDDFSVTINIKEFPLIKIGGYDYISDRSSSISSIDMYEWEKLESMGIDPLYHSVSLLKKILKDEI